MLKKVIASVITFMMIFTLTGCNETNMELLSKLSQASNWEAVKNEETIEVLMNYDGETVTVELESETYINSKDLQVEGSITLKSMAVNGEKRDLTSGEYKISPLEFYVDGFKVCIGTDAIKDIFEKIGITVPSELDPAYVGIDMTKELNQYLTLSGMSMEDIIAESKASIEKIAKLNVDMPTKRSGNTYTIKFDDSNMVDLLMDVMVEVYKMDGGVLDQIELSEEEKTEVITQLEKEKTGESAELTKQMLKGSIADVKFTTTDDSIDTDINMDFKIDTGYEKLGLTANMSSKSAKAEVKNVEFPNGTRVYTIEELANELTYNDEN